MFYVEVFTAVKILGKNAIKLILGVKMFKMERSAEFTGGRLRNVCCGGPLFWTFRSSKDIGGYDVSFFKI